MEKCDEKMRISIWKINETSWRWKIFIMTLSGYLTDHKNDEGSKKMTKLFLAIKVVNKLWFKSKAINFFFVSNFEKIIKQRTFLILIVICSCYYCFLFFLLLLLWWQNLIIFSVWSFERGEGYTTRILKIFEKAINFHFTILLDALFIW